MATEPPYLADELLAGIIAPLDIDAESAGRIGEQLHRFATAHWYLRRTFKPLGTYAGSRKAVAAIADLSAQLAALLANLHLEVEGALALSADHLRKADEDRRLALPSVDSLKFLSEVAGDVAARLPKREGRSNDRILELSAGAMMAVLERATGQRAAARQKRNRDYDPHLHSAEAIAIGKIFSVIEPDLLETTLANVIMDLNRRYRNKPMHEDQFLPLIGAPVYLLPTNQEH